MKYKSWLEKYMTQKELGNMKKDNPDDTGWTYEQASEYLGRHQIKAYGRWEKGLK